MKAQNATAKKKRVSKKLKKSWRKHVNIGDVEDYLEEERLKERLGKPISLVTDNELFHVDLARKDEVLTKSRKRKILLEKPPKCFSMLEPHTKVPAFNRRPDQPKKKSTNSIQNIRKEESIKKKQKQSKLDKEHHINQKQNKQKINEFCVDMWVENELEEKCAPSKSAAETQIKYKKHEKIHLRKKLPIPSIEYPHPGTSYNPSYEDHVDLLNQIAEKEKMIIKEEKHLNRVTRSMFRKVTEAERDKSWLEEMSEGLRNEENEDNSEEDSEIKHTQPVKNKKKTLKQHRKQKEQKQLKKELNLRKVEKKKVADIYKLRFLKKQIERQEEKEKAAIEKRKLALLEKEKKTKRVGSMKYEEPDLEYNDPSEISGSLRNIKKVGSLLYDRYKSLQKRNIIEPEAIRKRKSAKVKRFVRAGYKDDWKKTVAKKLS